MYFVFLRNNMKPKYQRGFLMDKKSLIFLGVASVSSLALTATLLARPYVSRLAVGDKTLSHILLDADTQVVAKDEGYLHQSDVKGTKIDMIGFTDANGSFGSIKKDTYGSYEWNGMVYNRSVINDFESITVNFEGGALYCVFTDFLMEDMDFDSDEALVSGQALAVPEGKAHFLLYTTSTTPVSIDSIDIAYGCDGGIDDTMIFDQNSTLGGARSLAKRTDLQLGYVELENNPTLHTNNYSTGSHGGHADSWYRFNGRYFANSAALGTDFSFGMTIIGNISQILDESKYFHYNVWPQLTYEGSTEDPNYSYIQTYIGNDNYEPLGADHPLHPSDPYTKASYSGRFFTDYNWFNNNWEFADPDVICIADGVTTFREAYEAYTLPYWFVKIHVYIGENDEHVETVLADVFINGFHLFTQEVFENYDVEAKPAISIKSLPMHVVNYGVDAEGNPADSYVGSFTYPRLIVA